MSGNLKYQVGQVVGAVSAKVEGKVTEPPSRYTESTLMSDMISAHKFAANDAEREILRQTEGLGTSRTREPTIRTLIDRKFLTSTRKGKQHELVSTVAARQLIKALPESVKNVVTTAKWEVALGMIERGQVKPAQFRAKMAQALAALIKEAKGIEKIPYDIPQSDSRRSQDVKHYRKTSK